MSVQELKNQAYKLSVSDRLELIKAIIYSLEDELRPRLDRKGAVERMRGKSENRSATPN